MSHLSFAAHSILQKSFLFFFVRFVARNGGVAAIIVAMETNALPAKPEEELIPTRASLLARLKDLGDDRSWTEFRATYRGLVRRCALNAGLSDADVDEVFQETVIA